MKFSVKIFISSLKPSNPFLKNLYKTSSKIYMNQKRSRANLKCKSQLRQIPALHQRELLPENRVQPASTSTVGAFAASHWILNLD